MHAMRKLIILLSALVYVIHAQAQFSVTAHQEGWDNIPPQVQKPGFSFQQSVLANMDGDDAHFRPFQGLQCNRRQLYQRNTIHFRQDLCHRQVQSPCRRPQQGRHLRALHILLQRRKVQRRRTRLQSAHHTLLRPYRMEPYWQKL